MPACPFRLLWVDNHSLLQELEENGEWNESTRTPWTLFHRSTPTKDTVNTDKLEKNKTSLKTEFKATTFKPFKLQANALRLIMTRIMFFFKDFKTISGTHCPITDGNLT